MRNNNLPQNTQEKQTPFTRLDKSLLQIANPAPDRLSILAEIEAVLDDLQAQGKVTVEVKDDFESVITELKARYGGELCRQLNS